MSENIETLTVIVPHLPPEICGVGDYAFRLAGAWPPPARFRFLVHENAAASAGHLPYLDIHALQKEGETLEESLESFFPGHLFVHYSGFGYDPLGYPKELIQALIGWKKKGGSLIGMFHELWHAGPWWTRPGLRCFAHRGALARLVPMMDAVFTNTDGYREALEAISAGLPVRVVPVFSTIGEPLGFKREREQGLLVLFGLQGTRLRVLGDLSTSLPPLFAKGRLRRFVVVGGGGTAEGSRREEAWLRHHLQPRQWERQGVLPAQEISDLLSQAEFGLTSESWEGFGKSTTFMAYAAHGVSILSNQRGEAAPFVWLTHPDDLSGTDVAGQGEQLYRWYRQHAALAATARRFNEACRQKR